MFQKIYWKRWLQVEQLKLMLTSRRMSRLRWMR